MIESSDRRRSVERSHWASVILRCETASQVVPGWCRVIPDGERCGETSSLALRTVKGSGLQLQTMGRRWSFKEGSNMTRFAFRRMTLEH